MYEYKNQPDERISRIRENCLYLSKGNLIHLEGHNVTFIQTAHTTAVIKFNLSLNGQ